MKRSFTDTFQNIATIEESVAGQPSEMPNQTAINLCKQYTDSPEEFDRILQTLTVEVRSIGIKKHFPDDKDPRQCLEVRLTRNNRKAITFEFGMSTHDTEILTKKRDAWDSVKDTFAQQGKKKEVFDDLLYSILACCATGYYCEKSFTDFCSEFGYDTDSRKAEITHRACLEQSAKLEKIFTAEEAQALPR